MIKLVAISPVERKPELDLTFSDGSHGRWSAKEILARDTVLTRPLADDAFFSRAFIEGGALAWPNGLELAPAALHDRLGKRGLLSHFGAAAE